MNLQGRYLFDNIFDNQLHQFVGEKEESKF